MDTRKIAAKYRLRHWAQAMQERVSSGKSIQKFCQDSGISRNTYFYWQRKLREAACEQMPAPDFAEVKLLEPSAQSTVTERFLSGQICAEADGVHITADSSYPVEKLAMLLRELRRP
jgi:transposase-like protein